MTPAVVRFRDRRALVLWLFALLWDAAVALLGAVVWAEAGGWKGWLALADSDPSYVGRIELRRACPIDLFGKARRASAEAEVARFNAAAGTATAFGRDITSQFPTSDGGRR